MRLGQRIVVLEFVSWTGKIQAKLVKASTHTSTYELPDLDLGNFPT
jgi:hypothetical protein